MLVVTQEVNEGSLGVEGAPRSRKKRGTASGTQVANREGHGYKMGLVREVSSPKPVTVCCSNDRKLMEYS